MGGIVAVGSTSPVKIICTKEAFRGVWPLENYEVTGVPVLSGVAEQPTSKDQTIAGARNRARAAIQAVPEAVFGIGLEGGAWFDSAADSWLESGWIVVRDRNGQEAVSSTAQMMMPKVFVSLMHEGFTLNEVV